ncbi:hypothetical protein P7C70_g3581, partial [Phenoliferia sp. Uapishka_3]
MQNQADTSSPSTNQLGAAIKVAPSVTPQPQVPITPRRKVGGKTRTGESTKCNTPTATPASGNDELEEPDAGILSSYDSLEVRLDFLFRVLKTAPSHHLKEQHRTSPKADVAQRNTDTINPQVIRHHILRNEVFAVLSCRLHLPEKLITHSPKVDLAVQKLRKSVQADMFEAYVGALYSEIGMELTREWVEEIFTPLIEAAFQALESAEAISTPPLEVQAAFEALKPAGATSPLPLQVKDVSRKDGSRRKRWIHFQVKKRRAESWRKSRENLNRRLSVVLGI